MSELNDQSRPKLILSNFLFFTITFLITLIGVPLYLFHFKSIPPFIVGLTFFYIVATGMSITVGYHRLFSHVTFKAHPVIEFLLLFFGAAAFEQSVLRWASQHRDHHRFVDTEKDPYSIKKGFFYAHIGWLLFWEHPMHYENAPDLQKNKMVMHQFKNYYLWSFGSGVIIPTLIGMAAGYGLAAFIFAVCARLVIVHHATFCINSVCHMFGRATYDIYSTAKDHWFVAFLTNGEGYHNFHHHFPGDYRNAVLWYQWDPSKWLIIALSYLGLTSDIKRVSKFRILEARLRADQQRVRDWMAQDHEAPKWKDLYSNLETRYKLMLQHLAMWEAKNKVYRAALYGKFQERTHKIQEEAEHARETFHATLEEWQNLVRSHSRLADLVF